MGEIMTLEKAIEIVRAINDRVLITHDIDDRRAPSLSGVSLADMLVAAETVRAENTRVSAAPRAPEETYSTRMVPAERLIAAAYVLEHYRPSNEPILCLPYAGFEGDFIALAVIALDAPAADEREAEDDDAARNP